MPSSISTKGIKLFSDILLVLYYLRTTESKMISEKSKDIFNTFGTYSRKGDKASKEKRDNFTREDLEFALSQHYRDRNHPIYHDVEKRIEELKEIERFTKDNKEKWKDRFIGFVAALLVGLLVLIAKEVFLKISG